MKILISGSSGLIGSALQELLKNEGHEFAFLVRRPAKASKNEIYWDPEKGSLNKEPLEDFSPDVVINLAGENISSGRWTQTRKQKIRDSRVNGTRILAQAISSLKNPPQVFICSSAIGYYGNRGEEVLTEESRPGEGFLAEVCQAWEQATQAAKDKGIRVVNLRTSVVLSKKGGALKKMLRPFKLGLGGVLGNGRQYFSWITLEDMVRVIDFAIKTEKLSGPVNAAAPESVTNRQFTKALGKVLWRPTLFPLPASTARMIFGEMADETLLASDRVSPKKLESAGFKFRHPELKEALRSVLKAS